MKVQICQGLGAAIFLSVVATLVSCSGWANSPAVNEGWPLEARVANDFFDALDDLDLERAARDSSAAVRSELEATARARKNQFGGRWIGDRNGRMLVHVERENEGVVVTFHARYEEATLEQVALVSCNPQQCEVTAFKESPTNY
jgi:hypothetical protein